MEDKSRVFRAMTAFSGISWLLWIIADYITFAVLHDLDYISQIILIIAYPIILTVFYLKYLNDKSTSLSNNDTNDFVLKWVIWGMETIVSFVIVYILWQSEFWLTKDSYYANDMTNMMMLMLVYGFDMLLSPLVCLLSIGFLKLVGKFKNDSEDEWDV